MAERKPAGESETSHEKHVEAGHQSHKNTPTRGKGGAEHGGEHESDRGGSRGGSHESEQRGGEGGREEADLKAREYRGPDGEIHHHTTTYMEQHRGENGGKEGGKQGGRK